MRKFLLYICLFIGLSASAQESDILQRIREANLKNTLRADFTQVRHSQLLTEDLTSSGFVALQAPDKVHWEVVKPVSRVTVFNGDSCGGCFSTITPQRLIDIASGKRLVICEHCGRIIVATPQKAE